MAVKYILIAKLKLLDNVYGIGMTSTDAPSEPWSVKKKQKQFQFHMRGSILNKKTATITANIIFKHELKNLTRTNHIVDKHRSNQQKFQLIPRNHPLR